MGDKTGIEWTDATWNPTTGCDKVSPGCDNCYALGQAARLKAMGQAKYQTDGDPATSGPGFGFAQHPDALDKPLRWTRPRRIFVNSMSDLFHSRADVDFIAQVFAVMALASQHTFQVLTKRPGRMRAVLSRPDFHSHVQNHMVAMVCGTGSERTGRGAYHDKLAGERREQIRDRILRGNWPITDAWPLPNVWVGTSVEDQKRADLRIPQLLGTPAAVRFLSCEPLLGPVELAAWLPPATCKCGHAETEHSGIHRTYGCQGGDGSEENPICGCRKMRGEHVHNMGDPYANHGLHWVIVGGESGPRARPMHPGWARALRDQCVDAGVAFHFKQWGEWAPLDRDPNYRDVWVFGEGIPTVVTRDGAMSGNYWCPWAPDTAGSPPGRRGPHGDVLMRWVGKHAAGRELDGRTWDEWPT